MLDDDGKFRGFGSAASLTLAFDTGARGRILKHLPDAFMPGWHWQIPPISLPPYLCHRVTPWPERDFAMLGVQILIFCERINFIFCRETLFFFFFFFFS